MEYIIGVDIGTTSTKVILYDDHGTQLARANNGYQLYQDAAGMAEEDPDAIYQAVLTGIATVVGAGASRLPPLRDYRSPRRCIASCWWTPTCNR